MPNIGEVAFDMLRGLPQALRTRVETWTVAGQDGYGAMTLGKADADFDLVTVRYFSGDDPDTNNTNAKEHLAACAAIQGTLVSIVDDWGDVYGTLDSPQTLVVKVDSTDARKACIYLGDAGAIRVEIHWKMLTVVVPSP